jgi:hypothetical protein
MMVKRNGGETAGESGSPHRTAALITEAGTDRAQGWRLPAQEIEDAVIRALADALTSPAILLERFGTAGTPSDQTRKMLDRATRLATALNRSPAERTKVVRDLIEKVVIEENTITIRVRRGGLLGGAVVPPSSENTSDSPVELAASVAFKRHGGEMRLVLPGMAIQKLDVRDQGGATKARREFPLSILLKQSARRWPMAAKGHSTAAAPRSAA